MTKCELLDTKSALERIIENQLRTKADTKSVLEQLSSLHFTQGPP